MKALAVLAAAFATVSAFAGLGPENIAVVVNGDSAASILIGQTYLKLRDIPRSNLIVLHDIGPIEVTDVSVLRKRILVPVFSAIRARGLERQIDCIAYSADFPFLISVKTDIGPRKLPQVLTWEGSINGLTYLCDWVMQGDIRYMQPDANWYARNGDQPGVGFRRAYGWNTFGGVGAQGPHYMLSIVLGVTTGRGNTPEEVLAGLKRAKSADFTRPDGVFYFEESSDVRTTTRQWAFERAVTQLRELGMHAEIQVGTLPIDAPRVAGAMIGTPDFNWQGSGSKILPGAICENFTSFGGDFRKTSGQTPCSVFIRNGAAGTSGTVTEPYAVQSKFPTAFMHVHYARGFTLIESYYLSVSQPYQLLILGDPLCRPWTKRREVKLTKGAMSNGILKLHAQLAGATSFELYVDGKLTSLAGPDGRLAWNSRGAKSGNHRLSVLARFHDAAASVYRAVTVVRLNP